MLLELFPWSLYWPFGYNVRQSVGGVWEASGFDVRGPHEFVSQQRDHGVPRCQGGCEKMKVGVEADVLTNELHHKMRS